MHFFLLNETGNLKLNIRYFHIDLEPRSLSNPTTPRQMSMSKCYHIKDRPTLRYAVRKQPHFGFISALKTENRRSATNLTTPRQSSESRCYHINDRPESRCIR